MHVGRVKEFRVEKSFSKKIFLDGFSTSFCYVLCQTVHALFTDSQNVLLMLCGLVTCNWCLVLLGFVCSGERPGDSLVAMATEWEARCEESYKQMCLCFIAR